MDVSVIWLFITSKPFVRTDKLRQLILTTYSKIFLNFLKKIHLALLFQLGYAVIDLEILNQSKIEDIFLSRFIALILQVL